MKQNSTVCSTCGHKTNEYKRRVTQGMCITLANLLTLSNENPNNNYFHISSFLGKGRGMDYSHLSYFALIESMGNSDPEKSSSGYWRITDLGRLFIQGLMSIPKFLIIREGIIIGKSDEIIFVKSCLKKNFDFRNLFNKGEVFDANRN